MSSKELVRKCNGTNNDLCESCSYKGFPVTGEWGELETILAPCDLRNSSIYASSGVQFPSEEISHTIYRKIEEE